MTNLVFHKGTLQHACGKDVDFFRRPFRMLFSTGLSIGLFTGFVVEKGPDQRVFLAFNNTTMITVSYY